MKTERRARPTDGPLTPFADGINSVPDHTNTLDHRLDGNGLASIRNGRTVIDNLSFTVEPEQTLLLMGPNGSGKSTLLRICAGLLVPDAGTLRFNGEDCRENPLPLHQNHHYVGHLSGVKTALTVDENLAVWSSLFALKEGTNNRDQALDRFGLTNLADTPAHYLSSGQKRRVALSRLVLAQRPLWLLDEPLTGLDEKYASVLEQCLIEHTATGGIAIVATHHLLDVPEVHRSILHLGERRP